MKKNTIIIQDDAIDPITGSLIKAPFAKEAQYLLPDSDHYQEILERETERLEIISKEFFKPSLERTITLKEIDFMEGTDETLHKYKFRVEAEFANREEVESYLESLRKAFEDYLDEYEGEAGVDHVWSRWTYGGYMDQNVTLEILFLYTH